MINVLSAEFLTKMASDRSEHSPPPLRIDTSRFEVHVNERKAELSPKAFDVLRLLAENSERVVEKEEIFSTIWGDSFVTDNALTRVIKEIRNELGDDAAAPAYIATVPKRGYRFIGTTEFVPDSLPPANSWSSQSRKTSHFRSTVGSQPTITALLLAGLIALVVLGSVIYWQREADLEIRSIVVIPLDNSTGDVNLAYLSEGITESLINDLSLLPSLRVISRTSSFRYGRSFKDAVTAGKDLGVHAVITGRVTKQEGDLIIQVELSDSETGAQIWGQRFSRRLDDLVKLESDIAQQVAARVVTRLSPTERQRIGRTYTENAAAYDAYKRGRHNLNKLSPPSVRSAVEFFQKAIDIDPTYAPAYVGLADANRALALALDGSADEFFPRSKAAASQAIEIDPDLSEAHAALGFATLFYDRDWRTAERYLRRALEINPNSSESRIAYSAVYTFSARFDEGARELGRARELDPLNLRASALEGLLTVIAGRVDEGIARLQSTIEIDPNFFLPHLFVASAYVEKRMLDKALEHAMRARELSNGQLESIATVGYLKGRLQDRSGAESLLAELESLRRQRYVPPYCIALIYNGMGETEKALEWLDTGLNENDPKLAFLPGDPRWRNLSNDPRFADLLNRIGFVRTR